MALATQHVQSKMIIGRQFTLPNFKPSSTTIIVSHHVHFVENEKEKEKIKDKR